MADFFGFSSDNINAYLILVDASSSMDSDSNNVRKAIRLLKNELEKCEEPNSIAVSICKFSDDFHKGEFTHVKNMDTSYEAYGNTAVYYSIVCAEISLLGYMKEIAKKHHCKPKSTFMLISDGDSYRDRAKKRDAKKAIQDLNDAGVNTVFIPLGEEITEGFGEELGFACIKDVKKQDLTKFFEEDLSESFILQSKSLVQKGGDFFSRANSSSSSKYSQKTKQVLEDDDWWNI